MSISCPLLSEILFVHASSIQYRVCFLLICNFSELVYPAPDDGGYRATCKNNIVINFSLSFSLFVSHLSFWLNSGAYMAARSAFSTCPNTVSNDKQTNKEENSHLGEEPGSDVLGRDEAVLRHKGPKRLDAAHRGVTHAIVRRTTTT
jgi:hypothetical protein